MDKSNLGLPRSTGTDEISLYVNGQTLRMFHILRKYLQYTNPQPPHSPKLTVWAAMPAREIIRPYFLKMLNNFVVLQNFAGYGKKKIVPMQQHRTLLTRAKW